MTHGQIRHGVFAVCPVGERGCYRFDPQYPRQTNCTHPLVTALPRCVRWWDRVPRLESGRPVNPSQQHNKSHDDIRNAGCTVCRNAGTSTHSLQRHAGGAVEATECRKRYREGRSLPVPVIRETLTRDEHCGGVFERLVTGERPTGGRIARVSSRSHIDSPGRPQDHSQ